MSVPKPTNRMILVNLVEEEQEENGILLPEDYKTPNRHLVGEVVAKAEDCTLPCLLYTSPSPRDRQKSRMPSSA